MCIRHKKNKIKKERIPEIDFMRGFLILFMIIDHIFFDFWGIMPQIFKEFSYNGRFYWLNLFAQNSYWTNPVRLGGRLAILSLFFLISGISCYFSRNNLKRGLLLLGVGVVISLGSLVAIKLNITGPSDYIFFGAITSFATSILIFFLIKLLFDKLRPNDHDDFKWLMLCFGLFAIGVGVLFGVFNLHDNWYGPARAELNAKTFIPIILGMKQDVGADWLPLFPYIGFLFIGYFLGETFYKDKKSLLPKLMDAPSKYDETYKRVVYYGAVMPYKGINKALCFTGKYSIFFYIFHQPIVILTMALVFMSLGCKLQL